MIHKFELLNRSYSPSDIEDLIEYIIKKHETLTYNSIIRTHIKKTENEITFKSKPEHCLKLLIPETMKLLERTEIKIELCLEITEVILIQCNIVKKDYHYNLRVLYTFVFNKSFGQLLDIALKIVLFLKTFHSQFSFVEVWFTEKNSKFSYEFLCNV